MEVYFDKDGVQAKGIFANADHFYDKDTGAAVRTKSSKSMANAIMLVKMVEKFTQEHILFLVKMNLIVGDGHQGFENSHTTQIVELYRFDGKSPKLVSLNQR
ncbi:MAG: hypothetical protein ACLS36_10070 [Streptococcus sp.]